MPRIFGGHRNHCHGPARRHHEHFHGEGHHYGHRSGGAGLVLATGLLASMAAEERREARERQERQERQRQEREQFISEKTTLGYQRIDAGDYEGALVQFQAVLTKDSSNAAAQTEVKRCRKFLGDQHFEDKEYEEAMKAYQLAGETKEVEKCKPLIAFNLLQQADLQVEAFLRERGEKNLGEEQIYLQKIQSQYKRAHNLDPNAPFSALETDLESRLENIQHQLDQIRICNLTNILSVEETSLRRLSLTEEDHLSSINDSCSRWLRAYDSLSKFRSASLSEISPKKPIVEGVQAQARGALELLKNVGNFGVMPILKSLTESERFPEKYQRQLVREFEQLFSQRALRKELILLTEEEFLTFQEKVGTYLTPLLTPTFSLVKICCMQDYKLMVSPAMRSQDILRWLQDAHAQPFIDIEERLGEERPPAYNPYS